MRRQVQRVVLTGTYMRRRSAANAAVEGQKPDEEIIRRQIEEMKTEIITKHREILWKKD